VFSKPAYAIKGQAGQYLSIVVDQLGIDISHDDSPERALIWSDRKQAEDLLVRVEEHLREKYELVEFELTKKRR
jgi:hypothetical protein